MPPKRKRLDRQSGEGGRPSPHRPGDTALGQHERDFYEGGGRSGRGGRGRRNDRRDSLQGQSGRGPPAVSSQPPTPTVARPISSSSQAPASQFVRQSPMPAAAPAPAGPPPPEPPYYAYDNLTDDKIAAWAQTGRQEVIEHGIQSRNDVDITELSSLFQEFVHSAVEGRLSAADAGTCVKEILGPETQEVIKDSYSFEPHTLFLDTIAIVMDNDGRLKHPRLREFLVATGVSSALMRQVLDATLLEELGLIRYTFVKLGIRHATNLLYRQANYNLLREETEGYAKLTTELFMTSYTEPPSFETAHLTFEKIKGLIGTFDMDVGRVLDILLDVFSVLIIRHYKLLVRLLRVSSWWPRSQIQIPHDVFVGGLPNWALPELADLVLCEEDNAARAERKLQRDIQFWRRAREVKLAAFFELGGREVTDPGSGFKSSADSENDIHAEAERKWVEITGTRPPPGNRIAAQLLGFKMRFYSSEAREDSDVLPANLLYLAALLIKIGFLSLCDLYPHIWPYDEQMPEWREKKMKEIDETERKKRPGAAMNALLMAAPLSDDIPPPPAAAPRARDAVKTDGDKGAATEKPAEKTGIPDATSEMKSLLLVNLLTIGAIPESLFILGRFPWLPATNPDIHQRIHRIIHRSIEKVYKESQPIASAHVEVPTKPIPDQDQTGAPKGTVKLSTVSPKKPMRWPFPDKWDTNELHASYTFYWDEWDDNVPICQTVDDIFALCGSFLNISGVNIGKDESLLTKLASIGAKSLAEDKSDSNLARWQELLRRLLVPALSLTSSNAAIVNSVWDLLKIYPTSTRYAIYAEWYEGATCRLPAIKSAFARTRLETLSTMKRLSLTNLSEMAKKLAKTSYSSPGVVFKVALDQIESYANLIEAFVECAKYFTELAYDVLVWTLMRSLGGGGRTRTQETSVLLTSKWLQALSRFSGKVFRRYSNMDSTPVVQYVYKELLNGNSTDLIILKELISSMGGVVPTVDFTDEQILAMSGGETLRRQTLVNVQDRRFDSARSSARLMHALINSRLAGPLLISLAQYRQSAIYKLEDRGAHIKYLATIVDDSHQILIQYLDLLRSNLEPDRFDSLVPSISKLMTEFGMDVNLAFLIGRDSLSSRMFPKAVKPDESLSDSAKKDGDGDVSMSDPATLNGVASQAAQSIDLIGPVTSGETDANDPSTPTSAAAVKNANASLNAPLDVLQPIIDSVKSTQPREVWQKISPEFYVMFWALHLGDLAVPEACYRKEQNRLIEKTKEVIRDRTDITRTGMQKKKKQQADLQATADALIAEMKDHMERFQKNKIYMVRRFKDWFPGTRSKVNGTSDTIIEQCILPRLMLSASDAEYCYKFVRFLHNSGAPNFRLMSLYDRFFNASRLRSTIFTCTVREAEHLGRFIMNILRDLSTWHKDKATYEKEALGMKSSVKKEPERTLAGFATAFDDSGKPTAFVEHAQFRDVLYGWHKNLNTALKSCLSGMEWMHIRNAITVLKAVIDFFPAVEFMGDMFAEQLKIITDREAATKTGGDDEVHRVDLSVAAQTALSELQRRKSKWIIVQAFRSNTTQGESKTGENSTTPSALRATAPEFKPKQPGRPPARTRSLAEVEDGEVKDGKDGKALPSTPTTSDTKADSLPAKPVASLKDSVRTNAPSPSNGDTATKVSSKPSTPKLSAAVPVSPAASRPELPKQAALNVSSERGNHGSHGLPSRPDVPFPGHFTSDRFGQVRTREPRDSSRDSRDVREPRGPREPRDSRDSTRDARDAREVREPREPREVAESRESRDRGEHRVPREPRESREAREREPREPRELREPREPRDLPHSRDSRDHRDPRDHRDTRENREPRGPESSRLDRPRDFSNSDRRPLDNSRETGRLSEKDWSARPEPAPRGRGEPGPHERDIRPPRDRGPPGGGRSHDSSRPPREPAGTMSSAPPSQTDAPEPPINPVRASMLMEEPSDRAERSPRPTESDRAVDKGSRLPDSDRPDIINPERAALIKDSRHQGPTRPPPPPRDNPRERSSQRGPSQRGISPHRSGDRFGNEHGPGDGGWDDRPGRSHHSDVRLHGRDTHAPNDSTPLGNTRAERGDRDDDRVMAEKGHESSSFHGPPAPRPPEAGRGRSSYQDQNYGRLSTVPQHGDIPSGPRGRGRGYSRGGPMSGPATRPDGRFPTTDSARAPTPELYPQTGPSGRDRRGQYDAGGAPITSPTNVAPTGSSHPDRSRHTAGPAASSPTSSSFASAPTGSGIHPDRLAQIAPPPPPPPPPPGPPPAHAHSRPPMNTPGNRQPSSSYSSSPAATLSAPTGPAGGDRTRSGGGRRQLTNINNTLQQTSSVSDMSRGGSLRRGSARSSLAESDVKILTGGSPVSTPTLERPDPIRHDANADRGAPNGDDHPGRGDHDRNRRDRDRSDRSGRPSRRSSRERDRSSERERDSKDPRDYRDRRLGAGPGPNGGGRDDREPPRRSSLRESTGANDRPSGGRGGAGGRELRHRDSNLGGGRGEEWQHIGRGGGRGGMREGAPRPGDERRELREDRSRKRRSEEGVGGLSSEREKRPRR